MSDPSEVLADGLHERIAEVAEYGEEYNSVMGYTLRIEILALGDRTEPQDEMTFDLSGSNVNILQQSDASNRELEEDFARVVEVIGDWGILYIEADHRGPEHGVDVWFGRDGDPEALVTDIEVEKDV